MEVEIEKARYYQISENEVIDVLKQILIITDSKGNKYYKKMAADNAVQARKAEGLSYKFFDNDQFSNPLGFEYDAWGWLGNQWLAKNNYRTPSWK